MHCVRNIFFCAVSAFLLLLFVTVTYSLQKSIIDSGILITEEIIRNTTNRLFSTLKLKKDNPRFNQYIVINKHFASITIQDHDHLNEISRLSRVNTENNESTIFMTVINDLLLNDDNDRDNVEENKIKYDVITENNDDRIIDIIETFLTRLRHARELHDVSSYVNINENVLNLIKEAQTRNTTGEREDTHRTTTNTTYDEIVYWTPSGRRIFSGERTKIKYFPFMASIQMFNNFQCAGSIIKSDLIITASSCLQIAWNNRFFRENPAFLSVRVGSSFYTGGGEVIPVLEVYFHPSYDPKTLRNNICLVRLLRKIHFSWRERRRVQKIEIDRRASKLPINTPGITILGWGAKGRSNTLKDPWSNILSYAVLDVYPMRDCQDIYSKEYVTNKNFCAGFISRGGGACNRDIGGPGVDEGTLVGVVSFGSPVCGAADAPTVFTKLGYYADWIEAIMEEEVPYSKQRTTLPPKTARMIDFTTERTTTFKIPPLPGKIKPTGINDAEVLLRMFNNDMFRDFMRTLFDSKEIAEYQDAFKEAKQNGASKMIEHNENVETEIPITREDKKPIIEAAKDLDNLQNSVTEFVTQLPDIESDTETATKLTDFDVGSAESEETTTNSNKVTIKSEEVNSKSDNVESIVDMIKNIDLKKIIEEETAAAENNVPDETNPSFINQEGLLPDDSKKNDSVLTLLYLSEENKNKAMENQEYIDDAGLSIADDSFLDLTRTKGKSIGSQNGLPEKELYEILSEVIDDQMHNNETLLT